MTDFLLQANLSNLIVASLLSLIALSVQRWLRSPALAHLLWACVLVKLITPPLFSVGLFELPRVASAESVALQQPTLPATAHATSDLSSIPSHVTSASESDDHLARPVIQNAEVEQNFPWWGSLLIGWLIISCVLLSISLTRILRFHWLLKKNSELSPVLTSQFADQLARRFGLKQTPPIVVTAGNIAPFVWWLHGQSVIVTSRKSIEELDEDDFRWVMAHEMAHIKRRDHWFRWVEYFSSIVLWWNPLIWWVRHQLRKSEELACDELVLKQAGANAHQYAHALLNVAELLTTPAIRPPNVATAINSGGILEKRLKMIIADHTNKVPAIMRIAIAALAITAIPLGVVYGQDFGALERRLGGAVEAGEITLEQANLMLNTLRKSKSAGGQWDLKKARYAQYVKEIQAAVKAGKLSKADAERKLIELRKEQFAEAGRTPDRGQKKQSREIEANQVNQIRQVQRDLEAAVKAGKLSKEDAEKKLQAVRKELSRHALENKAQGDHAHQRQVEANERVDRLRAIQHELMAAVKAGKLSKEDAEQKLQAIRKDLLLDAQQQRKKPHNEYLEKKRSAYDQAAQKYKQQLDNHYHEIEAAVKAGKLSKEAAQKELLKARSKVEQVFKELERQQTLGKRNEMEAKLNQFQDIQREIEAAVKAGKLSKQNAEKKLIELRRKVLGDQKK